MAIHDERETSRNREHDEHQDYRPLIIRTKSLVALMVLTSSLIILLEVLRQILPTSPRTQFTTNFFQHYSRAITIAPAILFACIWTAVDLNVMRMEPIYQIAESKEDQTGLNDSLFFSYTTCSALTVPLHALKRKHWAVLYSSLANLVASIALPAIVVEIFDVDYYAPTRVDRSGSKRAILASVYGSPFGSFFVALRNGYIYPLTIAFTTILSEVLTIFLPGLFRNMGYALILPTIIPVFMLVIWGFAFWRTKKRGLPKSPETIAGALSYLCESRLPGDLKHMKGLNDEERRKAIEAMDRDYVLELTPGMDGGGLRWTIDSTI